MSSPAASHIFTNPDFGAILKQSILTRGAVVLAALFAVSVTALMIILSVTGISLKLSEFATFVFLAALLFVLSAWCYVRNMDQRLAGAAEMFGTLTISLLLCGMISNTGLRLNMPVADSRLAAADAALGLHMPDLVFLTAETPWLSAILAFAYNWSAIAVVVTAIALLGFSQITKARLLTVTAAISMQIVAIVSVFFPAKGTAFYYDLQHLQGNGIPAGAAVYAGETFDRLYYGSETLIGLADFNGVVVFPSFHTILGLLIAQALWSTKLKWAAAGWAVLVVLSTIPMGGHFAVDLMGGIIVWVISYRVAQWALTPPPGPAQALNTPSS